MMGVLMMMMRGRVPLMEAMPIAARAGVVEVGRALAMEEEKGSTGLVPNQQKNKPVRTKVPVPAAGPMRMTMK